MQAIRTRYVGATARLGQRVMAKCGGVSVHHVYDDGLDIDANHKAACELLRRKMGWVDAAGYPPMVAGHFQGDTYWVFCYRHFEAGPGVSVI